MEEAGRILTCYEVRAGSASFYKLFNMGRAVYKCCVKGCTNKGGISHRFPNPRTRLDLLQKWINIIGFDQFNELSDCYSPGTKVLNFNAVPSLNLMLINDISTTDTNDSPSIEDIP